MSVLNEPCWSQVPEGLDLEGHRRSDRLGRAALSRGHIGLEFAMCCA